MQQQEISNNINHDQEKKQNHQQPQDKQQKQKEVHDVTKKQNQSFVPPAIGSRIEVLWKIEDDGNEHERWWGATIQDCTKQKLEQQQQQDDDHNNNNNNNNIYILLYDSYDSFVEETVPVQFLSHSTLLDVSMKNDQNDGILDWRIEGDTTNNQNQDESVVMSEIAQDYENVARQVGLSHDADLQALGHFSAHVQGQLAVGYRHFADNVKRMLAELMAQKPEGYIVTEADVHDIFARLHATRAT